MSDDPRRLTLGRLGMTVALALSCVAGAAQAPDRPGPMQSGRHAAPAPVEGGPGGTKQAPSAAGTAGKLDVNQLFAASCSWCHLKGGREAGKGPKLMDTPLTDSELISRIRNGKVGQMPAFGSSFSDEQLAAIVAYIRELKP